MATNQVYVNVKDLPQLSEVSNGDYILVETNTGTHIIDFKDFILPIDNTLITTAVSANGLAISTINTNILSLQTNTDTITKSLSDKIDSNYNTQTSLISSLSDQVKVLKGLYIGKCQITINSGTNTGTNILLPTTNRPNNLLTSDIMIFPSNEYAAKNQVFVSNYDASTGLVTIKGNFLTKELYFDESNPNSIYEYSTFSNLSGNTISQFLNALSYKETSGNATESAIYTALVIVAI